MLSSNLPLKVLRFCMYSGDPNYQPVLVGYDNTSKEFAFSGWVGSR